MTDLPTSSIAPSQSNGEDATRKEAMRKAGAGAAFAATFYLTVFLQALRPSCF